jgi:hypothetical protein
MPDRPSAQSAPTKQVPAAKKAPRRGWWGRLWRGLLILLLALAIFHRPLFHTVMRLVLIKAAAYQNVKLDVKFSGTIFTNLSVKDVQALPTGQGPSPVEKITITAVNLEYSIPDFIRHGLSEFLSSYEIRNADLVFSGEPSKNKDEKEQKKSLAQTLNTMLGQPALYADKVRIENFNLRVNSPGEPVVVEGINAYFHPWEPGYLKIGRIKVPNLPAWENIAGETSYANRNLYVRGMQLAPEIVIEELNFDASRRAQDKGSTDLRARLFGGTFHLGIAGEKLQKKGENLKTSYDTNMQIEAAGIDLQAAAAYFNLPKPPVARLGALDVDFIGEPEKPRTWSGTLSARVETLAFGKAKVDYAQLHAVFRDGQVDVTSAEVATGKSAVRLTAKATLPETINDFSKTEGDAEIVLAAPSLEDLTKPFMPQPVSGTAKGGGTVGVHQQKVSADLAIEASGITRDTAAVESLRLKLTATKSLAVPEDAPPLQGLVAKVSADVKTLRFGTFTADSAAVEADALGERVRIQRAEVVRGENSVSVTGTYIIPQPGQPPAPIEGELAVRVPKLEDFGVGKGETILTGHLNGNAQVRMENDSYTGKVDIAGGDFTFGEFKARKFTAAVGVANNEATIERLALEIDQTAQIAVTGKTGVQAPYPFEAALLVLFNDLKVLQPLLATFGVKEPIAGSVDLSLEGQGNAQSKEMTGQMKLAVDNAEYGKIAVKEARLAGLFGPQFAESTELKVVSGETVFQAGLAWRENRLRIKDIDLRQGEQQALTGFILLPLEPQNAEQPIPFHKRIAANVNARSLDIEKLMASFGKTAPASGTINMNLVLGGTILKPTAHLKAEGRRLSAPAMKGLDPAEVDLVAHYSERELTLDVIARQKEIQPLTIKGRVPLDLEAAIQDKKLDPNLPLDLRVKLPPTSLAFVTKFAPTVRSIEGRAGIDAHVGGTVQKPSFSGQAVVKVDYARMKSEGVPAIGALDVDIGFTESAITMRRFRGEVGGGTFQVTGGVQFPKITEPVFALRLQSDEVLVKRDDSVTVRVDSDVAVSGPLAAGRVYGTVWVAHSRFFRDIDILPIALPGRPKPKAKPQPRQVQSSGGPVAFSLPPPLSAWTFDIAIKTRPDDPFKIQGNLANGAAAIDLHFGGTGAAPWLDGNVQVNNLKASLPFSTLEVRRGFVYFTRERFAEPTLDIYAESKLRDYQIQAYITGPARNPEVSLTSEPPLPQQDIISLLATGTTMSELTGSADVLASRAAVLLFQQLYRKVFKKKDPTEGLPMADRLSMEVGAVDSKTGRQELQATFRLGGELYLVGDVDVSGEFTGRLKYLLRFK